MSKKDKGNIVSEFEDYLRIKTAERHIDFLLDMCGSSQVKEDMDPLASSMHVTGRPYDHPRKIRIKPIVNVNIDSIADDIESDMRECDAVQGEKYPGEFEGAAPNNLPAEQPAKEMTPQKKQNKINTVPNQDAAGLLTSIKGEMMDEMALGSRAASQLVRKAKILRLKYKAAGQHLSMKQAARMAGAG